MKKITVLLIALIAGVFAVQTNAQPAKAPARSQVYDNPGVYQQLDDSKIYWSISNRRFASSSEWNAPSGPSFQHAISLLGEINGQYYSSTYGTTQAGQGDDGRGAGFLSAFKVGNNSATFANSSEGGTTANGVTMTARIEAAGEQAALITYTLTNNNGSQVNVSVGVYADIMIGANDHAPISTLKKDGEVYGLKMKESVNENAPLFCALFGDGVTGVTAADDYWFGRFDHNYSAEQLVGDYSDVIVDYSLLPDIHDSYYMVEDGSYDSGMGFCWKNRPIAAGESIELSYIISVGEFDMEEPFVPGDDRFEYEVEAYNFENWNDLTVAHPAHVWGYYEHPYGLAGYIEYQVDGMRSWTRIPTELVSGENFDLPFDMFFNADITTTHTLELRFNDGLGNTSPMTGLSWTDVRSIPVNGFEDRPYTGEPQIFEVTVGDSEPFTIGEDGDYIYPGDYSWILLGDFNNNTIGENEIEFSILNAETGLIVTIPEDCVYDGEAHAATAEIEGDGQVVITYKDENGVVSENAPVEPGTYEVFVEVINSTYYNDIPNASYGEFTIDKAQSEITFTIPDDVVYDGEAHGATVEVVVGDGELTVTYKNTATGEILTEAPVAEGTYEVIVEVAETDHYYGIPEGPIGTFSILADPTAVNEITINNEDNGAWYTIDGKRVVAPTERGIYIHNGKKYVK